MGAQAIADKMSALEQARLPLPLTPNPNPYP